MPHDIPTRLYDCEHQVLKNRQEILQELGGVAPSYLIVSHVWGDSKDTEVRGIRWPVPISEGKFDKVLDYCLRMKNRWMWIDCACIRQKNDPKVDSAHDKEAEVGRMNQYYKNASECLCIPSNPDEFLAAYLSSLQLRDLVDKLTLDDKDVRRVWKNIDPLNALLHNSWFERTWTYQELLLSSTIRLLDGTTLDTDYIGRLVDWYYVILRKGILRRPSDGEPYPYVDPDSETVISEGWWVPVASWKVKPTFAERKSLDLMTAVSLTRNKASKYPADQLYGLYGLIEDVDKVDVDYEMSLDEEERIKNGVLDKRWKETVISIVESGRVWPLLMDAMLKGAIKGEIWMPRITAPELSFGDIHAEVIPSRNDMGIHILRHGSDIQGLRMSVRPVGMVVGASANFGDGGGEINRIVTCTWILGAMGFDTRPIKKQLGQGLSKSDVEKGENPKEATKALYKALDASSLGKCFTYIEDGVSRAESKSPDSDPSLRKKLNYGVTGWNRCVICISPRKNKRCDKPLVFLSWIHRESCMPKKGRCWVLDVTSIGQAKRWIIANREEDGTYTKIGTVESHSIRSINPPMEIILN